MKKIFPVLAALLVSVAPPLSGDDLTTLDGTVYHHFRVRKVNPDSLLISFLDDRGEPDAAEIPLRELPESIRKFYPAPPVKSAAPAAEPEKSSQRPPPAPPVSAPPSHEPGSDGALHNELTRLTHGFAAALGRLAPDDRSGRKNLAAQVRARLERLLEGYAREVECDFVTVFGGGTVVRIIGTPAGSPLRSGSLLYIAGGKPPAYRSFRAKFYPTGGSAVCGKYGTLPLYGADAAHAMAPVLENMADLAGEPLFFTAASEPVVPEPAEPVKSTPVQINNIYVESDRSDWWRYGRRVVIYPDRPPRPKPKPDKPGKPDDPDEPDKPDKPKKPGKSGTSPVFPSGSGTPRPIRWPSAPAASGNGSTGRYGLLPDWAAPGQTGAPVRSGK